MSKMMAVKGKTMGGTEIVIEYAECAGVSEAQANYGTNCKTKAFSSLIGFLSNAGTDKVEAFLSKYDTQLAIIKADTNAKSWIEGEQDIRQRIKALIAK